MRRTKVLARAVDPGPPTLVPQHPIDCDGAMTDTNAPEILVGFSHSAASAAALRWAVAEGKRRGSRVRVLHVHDRLDERSDAVSRAPVGAEHTSGDLPSRALDLLGDLAEDAELTIADQAGDLVATLIRASAGAELLVIGQPGHCRHQGIDDRLRRAVACPVTVVPAS